MNADVCSKVLSLQPFSDLMELRRSCRLFKYGISLLLTERLKELSEQDFIEIKKFLEKDKRRICCLAAIKHEKLKETVALVHASSNYVLWERWQLKDITSIQNNICSFHDFLLCRSKYIEALEVSKFEETLKSILLSRIIGQSEEIQKVLKFSSDSWVSKYEIKTIAELYESLPNNKINDNDRFHLALYHMYLNRTKSSFKQGLNALLLLTNHAPSQWILGDYYLRDGGYTQAITHMRNASSSKKPEFAYRFAMFLNGYDSITHDIEIKNLLVDCMKANYPLAYYSYGLMIKKKKSAKEASEYFEKGASLGCVEAKLELNKILQTQKDQKSCIIQ
jgi:hypothetical protein